MMFLSTAAMMLPVTMLDSYEDKKKIKRFDQDTVPLLTISVIRRHKSLERRSCLQHLL